MMANRLGWLLVIGGCLVSAGAWAETPGQFRPRALPPPGEKVGATGLKVQPPELFPKGRGPLAMPKRKPKLAQKGKPTLRSPQELVLNAGWELIEAPKIKADGATLSCAGIDTRPWYDATVPGTVLTTLVEQGVYPDPYFGLNNLAIPESLNRQDYWYRTEFRLPAGFVGRQLWLDFQGINYYAEVWFNGQYLGHITGAFVRGQFNVTKWARPDGPNVLAVMTAPPPHPGLPHEQSVADGPGDNGGLMCLDGPTFVCTEGWDWIPAIRDRCTGLWQDVIVRATGPLTLGDPQVITQLPLPDTSSAEVSVGVSVRNVTGAAQAGVLRGEFEGVRFEQPVTLKPGQSQTVVFQPAEFPQLRLKQPRLWWPNGYGKPELYHLKLSLATADGKASDARTLRFGVRQMTYELAAKLPGGKVERVEFSPTVARQSPQPVLDVRRATLFGADADKPAKKVTPVGVWPGAEHSPALRRVSDEGMGAFLIVKVNGQRILCRGGNWGMEDALKRISRARLEPYMRLHRDAHLTMIRNWAGQSTSDVFYELCDEYGLLVWNDFWLNTEGWNYNPLDHELFLRNVADTLARYRNHPSIALWCPRNEGVPPEPLNMGIDRLIRELDGTRLYQCNSRLINLRSSGPWSNQPLEKYFKDLNQGFSTELGACSVPSAEVMRTMLAPADLWPADDAWAYHDFHSKKAGDRESLLKIIAQRYTPATNLEDLCRKAQMVNYDTYRAIFEGFGAKLWNSASGVLVWMSHPSWPSVVWQFYTWDYEPNAALFGAQQACEPLHVQWNLDDGAVAVVNQTAQPLKGLQLTARVFTFDGKEQGRHAATLDAPASACVRSFAVAWPTSGPQAWFLKLELRTAAGRLVSDNFYWHAAKEEGLQALNSLPQVQLTGTTRVQTAGGKTLVHAEVKNPSSSPAVLVRLSLRAGPSDRRVLPAYYSCNYFSLLPGESRSVTIEAPAAELRGATPQIRVDGWNIASASLPH